MNWVMASDSKSLIPEADSKEGTLPKGNLERNSGVRFVFNIWKSGVVVISRPLMFPAAMDWLVC